MERLIDSKEWFVGKARLRNNVYRRMQYALPIKRVQRANIPRGIVRNRFVRVRYVRYADDFLIAVLGPYRRARKLKFLLRDFLQKEMELKLSLDKTKITPASKETARFLGMDIKVTHHTKRPLIRGVRSSTRILFYAPVLDIAAKLAAVGIGKEGKIKARGAPSTKLGS